MKQRMLALFLTIPFFLTTMSLSSLAANADKITADATIACEQYHFAYLDNDGSLWWRRYEFPEKERGVYGALIDEKIAENVLYFDTKQTGEIPNEITMFYIDENLTLWGFGENHVGELGNGTQVTTYTPQRILEDVISVSCDSSATYAITSDHSLYFWGIPPHIYILIATEEDVQRIPKKIMENVIKVSADNQSVAAITADGTLYRWGYEFSYEEEDQSIPVKIAENVIDIVVTPGHYLMLKEDLSLWSWGSNTSGELGIGSYTNPRADGVDNNKSAPVKVMDNVIAISGNQFYSLAVTADGRLWGWGSSYKVFTEANRPANSNSGLLTPTFVAEGIVDVSAGIHDWVALKDDGTLLLKEESTYFEMNLGYDDIDPATGLYIVAENVKLPQRSSTIPVYHEVFKDVKESEWFFGAVSYAYDNKLFSGTAANTFSPNSSMTSAMMVQVLYNMGGEGAQYNVPAGSPWYANAIAWGEEKGIMDGIPGFDPERNTSREQMVVLLRNYAVAKQLHLAQTRTPETFADADQISPWAKEALDVMYAASILNGKGDGRFDPQGSATRAEVATMFMNFSLAIQ